MEKEIPKLLLQEGYSFPNKEIWEAMSSGLTLIKNEMDYVIKVSRK